MVLQEPLWQTLGSRHDGSVAVVAVGEGMSELPAPRTSTGSRGTTLRIELAQAREAWVGVLGLLSGNGAAVGSRAPSGTTCGRRACPSPRCTAGSPAARTHGAAPEQSVPGMGAAMEALHREITAGRWVMAGRADHDWQRLSATRRFSGSFATTLEEAER